VRPPTSPCSPPLPPFPRAPPHFAMFPPLPHLAKRQVRPPPLGALLLSVQNRRGRNKVFVFAFVVRTRGTRFLHVGCVLNRSCLANSVIVFSLDAFSSLF
jgi:hypothetical protein